jgi:hypothetical protein
MDGLGRAAGSGGVFRHRGKLLWMEPLRLRDWGSCEQYLLTEEGTSLDAIGRLAAVDPAAAQRFMEQHAAELRRDKANRIVSPARLTAWVNTLDGIAFTGWLTLKGNGFPWSDLDGLGDAMESWPAEELQSLVRCRDRLSGNDLLANLDWPADDGGRKSRWTPWRRLYRSLAREFRMSADEVSNLTLYQIRIYTAEERELGGIARVSREEGMAYYGR